MSIFETIKGIGLDAMKAWLQRSVNDKIIKINIRKSIGNLFLFIEPKSRQKALVDETVAKLFYLRKKKSTFLTLLKKLKIQALSQVGFASFLRFYFFYLQIINYIIILFFI